MLAWQTKDQRKSPARLSRSSTGVRLRNSIGTVRSWAVAICEAEGCVVSSGVGHVLVIVLGVCGKVKECEQAEQGRGQIGLMQK